MKSSRLLSSSVGTVVLLACMVGTASPAPAQSGTTVPEDSPVFKSFLLLKSQPSYHTTMNMKTTDPRMAQAEAMGLTMSAPEKIQQGDTSQVIMHMKLPATDAPGTIDDWEIRAVARNGRAARMFSSPAIPRLKKKQEESFAMQMAMLERQAGMAIAQALALGPYGAIRAGMLAGETAAFAAMATHQLHEAEHFWDWKCMDQGAGGANRGPDQMTDAKLVGDDTVNGTAVTAYDFNVADGRGGKQPVRLFIAKDTSLPLRIHVDDPAGRGSVDMDYSYGTTAAIEVPECLGK